MLTKFLCPQNFVVPKTFFIKTHNKNKNLTSLKTHFAAKNLNPAYGLV